MTSLSWALGSSITNNDKSPYITVTDNKIKMRIQYLVKLVELLYSAIF